MGGPQSRRLPVSLRKRARHTDPNDKFKAKYSSLKNAAVKLRMQKADPCVRFDHMMRARSLLRALGEEVDGTLDDKNRLITRLFTDLPKTIGFGQIDAERIYKKTLEDSLLKESPADAAFDAVVQGQGREYDVKIKGVEDFIKKAKRTTRKSMRPLIQSLKNQEVTFSIDEMADRYVEAYALFVEGKKLATTGAVPHPKKKRFNRTLSELKEEVAYLECIGFYGVPPDRNWTFSVSTPEDAKESIESILASFDENYRSKVRFLIDPKDEDYPDYVVILHGEFEKGCHISALSKFNAVVNFDGIKQNVSSMLLETDLVKGGMSDLVEYRSQYLQDMVSFFRSEEFRKTTGLDGMLFTWPYGAIKQDQWQSLGLSPYMSLPMANGGNVILSLKLVEPYDQLFPGKLTPVIDPETSSTAKLSFPYGRAISDLRKTGLRYRQ